MGFSFHSCLIFWKKIISVFVDPLLVLYFQCLVIDILSLKGTRVEVIFPLFLFDFL